MTDASGPEDPEALRAEATAWFVRVQSDAAGEDDWLALEAWLTGSPQRRAAMDDVEALWRELDGHAEALAPRLEAVQAAEVINLAARRGKAAPARPRWSRWSGWAVAASLVVAVLGAAALWSAGPPRRVLATDVGETRSFLLADGSRIQLNSASRLEARVSRTRRQVTLDSGEAIFDIAKDSTHPFTVLVGDQRVTVVGTEFDILRHDGRIAVTVSRGVVEVGLANVGDASHPVRLLPGQQLARREGAPLSQASRIAVEDVFSWRDGYVVYRVRTLADVASDLNRYFPVPIKVAGPAARLTFSGALMIDDESAVIGRLQSFLPIKVVRDPDSITLSLK